MKVSRRGEKKATTVQATVTRPRRAKRRARPAKPYKTFPLYAHPTGQWAKVIQYKTRYFGPWDDPYGALERYQREAGYLHQGEEPPVEGLLSIKDLVNLYLARQLGRCESGAITRRTYIDYLAEGRQLLDLLGRDRLAESMRPPDWAKLRVQLAETSNPTTLLNRIRRIRGIWKWAFESELLPAPRYGGEFSRPRAALLRAAPRANGPTDYTREEVLALLDACGLLTRSGTIVKAMVLLGINAGMKNTDFAELRDGDVDLTAGWLDDHRHKTKEPRRVKLWPQTIIALQAVIADRDRRHAKRPMPPDVADRIFVTRRYEPYVHLSPEGKVVDSVVQLWRELCPKAGVVSRGRGFSRLRDTYRTIADETLDQVAIALTMGHAPQAGDEIAAGYRQRIGDDRLERIAEHVHAWLWPRE